MKLWLDDVRKPPDETWVWCKSAEEALNLDCEWEECSLDHDLGGQLAHYGRGPYDFSALTGADFLRRMNDRRTLVSSKITIHSTNTRGSAEMVALLHALASLLEADIEIIVRPMRGRIMDRTPHYQEHLRA